MPVLTSQQRKLLEDACVRGRRASEQAVRAALSSLAITADRPPAHLSADDRKLRRGLRAKARQLGDTGDALDLLIAECAYEQWHRLLFARFLAENSLLIHPEYRAPVTLEECEELADSLGEPDGWAVASRFAAEILPGIFRLDDPCVQLRLAPEGRLELEGIVASLPPEMLRGDDALGWVYQYWQKEQKDEVNRSERKIGGADIGPVTQLFTENYMVRFLLENSLGAWWAVRHPDSPLLSEWEYLRLDESGRPASGSFDAWPSRVGQVTIMDPCCGSGHFLVEAFGLLWRMRAEEEGLDPVSAQDAVLRDNLFGLELDARCVQIAMFAIALQAWKAGGGWRDLPTPHIACSGIPVKAAAEEWVKLANGDPLLANALTRLHILFRDADTLGSLIDPKRSVELSDPTGVQRSLEDVEWDDVSPLLATALSGESVDPATAVLGAAAASVSRAADYLARRYTLVVTNVPYLGRSKQVSTLVDHVDRRFSAGRWDLASAFLLRAAELAGPDGDYGVVAPQAWMFLKGYEELRVRVLQSQKPRLLTRLGAGAFGQISGEVVNVSLALVSCSSPSPSSEVGFIDCESASGPVGKAAALASTAVGLVSQASQMDNPMAMLNGVALAASTLIGDIATSFQGTSTGDAPRFLRKYWEFDRIRSDWAPQQGTTAQTVLFGGRENLVLWEDRAGELQRFHQNGWGAIRGEGAWGGVGVALSQMGSMPCTLYTGDLFDNSSTAIVPARRDDVMALYCFLSSDAFASALRAVSPKMSVEVATVQMVPIDVEHWRKVSRDQFPIGVPEPRSDDPTQWLCYGRPPEVSEPLQVGVGRLLGYRWPPNDEPDPLDELVDGDGIVCLPSVRGERTASDRLQELLARAFGGTWSPTRTQDLLADSGSKKKDLESWLRDDFFKAHCKVFKNRPFIWQIWDGRKDGFSALVNYHRLDRSTLEKLTYSYLGDWIERQTAGVREDAAGAEERLAAARALQQKLELILEGEPPYDIYVRWKSLAEQPIGWEPDLNDGVRLNVRPFVQAGVLRSKFNVKWEKDRGKNADGSERLNDLHYTHAEKRAARGGSA